MSLEVLYSLDQPHRILFGGMNVIVLVLPFSWMEWATLPAVRLSIGPSPYLCLKTLMTFESFIIDMKIKLFNII